MNLHPTLWRTCRVLASETRLALIWLLFDEGKLSVNQLAQRTGMSCSNASNQLRAISARGLIQPRREKLKVFYRVEANHGIDFAPGVVDALKTCHERGISRQTVIRQSTAFTHARRIEIVRVLKGKKFPYGELQVVTGISLPALARHLEKLEVRGFVKNSSGVYRLARPSNPLGRKLLAVASIE